MSSTPRSTFLRGAAGLTLAGAVHALTFAPGPMKMMMASALASP